MGDAPLTLRFLGEIQVLRAGRAVALPPSKKTRALLAYLAMTGREHRRDRLCALLWDVTDDPRGALRWSLSKLRPLVDGPDAARIVADRENVGFRRAGARIDALDLRERLSGDLQGLADAELEEAAAAFRGEFLEGLELADFHDFQAWRVGEAERLRGLHVRVLGALVARLSDRPEAALPHAQRLAQVDPLSEAAHAALLRLLAAAGRGREARARYEASSRLLGDLKSRATGELEAAWREASRGGPAPAPSAPTPSAPAPRPAASPAERAAPPLVGREAERGRLLALLDEVRGRRAQRVLLLTGEPGVGKTRLLGELTAAASAAGGSTLGGAAYEVESGRPYGPWIDALGAVPWSQLGPGLAGDLAPLLPNAASRGAPAESTRDRLFGAVAELVASRAHSAPPVVLAFDDVQWCDEASASLLHYVLRMNRYRPVLAALAARDGELLDNTPVSRMLRAFRREGLLEEIAVCGLAEPDVARLVREVAPAADARRVYAESAGNPLFALELARAAAAGEEGLSRTLGELVRDRLERLPPKCADVLRWGAALGGAFGVRRLQAVASLEDGELMEALETLERHGLARPEARPEEPQGAYAFAHDVVRRAVYGEVSEPRRRLMHRRIADALLAEEDADEALAADVARHAARAGAPEIAARACVAAGRRCLRLFANAEAEAAVRRGMRYAEEIAEPERTRLLLELHQVRYDARPPQAPEEAAREIEALAERAAALGLGEHARLGHQILSHLRWERGEWSDAERHTRRAEAASRTADDAHRALALAETARCLAMLERDLPHAAELLRDAEALACRNGVEPDAIADANGLLRWREGDLEAAARLFDRACALARARDDGHGEFQALEHLTLLELDRGRPEAAAELADELVALGGKLRSGSEAPFARALAALARYAAAGAPPAGLEDALEALRLADAKHRLASVLVRAADLDLARGDAARARARAEEALRLAEAVKRPTEAVSARAALARAHAALGDAEGWERAVGGLGAADLASASAWARVAAERARADGPGGAAERPKGG